MAASADERLGEASALRANFRWFSVQVALNHAVVTTPLVVASSELAPEAGYLGNALLYVFTIGSSLLLGAPAVHLLGPKSSVLLAMFLYSTYVALFAAAAAVADGAAAQHVLFGAGSCLAGLGAGILWTGQGSYFARTVDLILQQDTSAARPALTAELAAQFAFLYLALEVTAKALWALLLHWLRRGWLPALLFAAMGFLSLGLMTFARSLEAADVRSHCLTKVAAAISQWGSPTIWLIAGPNLTFGFSAAFMNGFVGANYTEPQLGQAFVPLMASLTTLTAAAVSCCCGPACMKAVGLGKSGVLTAGAVGFLCLAVFVLVLGCCQGWRYWLVLLYLCQGIGRGVYESTNKSVFADFFPRPSEAPGAFANVMIQCAGAQALCFFLSSHMTEVHLMVIVAVLAGLTPFGYEVALRLKFKARSDDEEQQPLFRDDGLSPGRPEAGVRRAPVSSLASGE